MKTQRQSRASISRRLTRTIFRVTVATLVIACLALVAFDWISVRSSISRNTETVAKLLGINLVNDLMFYDAVGAEEILNSLSAA